MATAPVVRVERFQADLHDSDRATQQTVERMAKHIRECASDPEVIRAARGSLRFGNDAAWSAWWWAKHNLTFKQDDELLGRLLNDYDSQLELLISPAVMVRMNPKQGDCDDFTMLLCCFLQALGCDWEIITVAADRREPWRWSHVYACALLKDGQRIPLDASHGKYPGWQVPSRDVFRYQAWGRDGQPVPKARGNDYRLHGYKAGRGMGATCNWYDELGNCLGYTADMPASDSTGFNWGGLITNLANQWTQIGSRVIAPTTTVSQTKQGTQIVTPGALPSGAALLTGGGSIGGISPLLLLGGLGLGALLLVSLSKK